MIYISRIIGTHKQRAILRNNTATHIHRRFSRHYDSIPSPYGSCAFDILGKNHRQTFRDFAFQPIRKSGALCASYSTGLHS